MCAKGKCVANGCPNGGPCIAFVTSETRTGGDIGGIAGGNALCQTLAAEAGLPGTYLAWLSDSEETPLTSFVRSTGPYIRIDETEVAASFAALISSGLQQPIVLDEEGTDVGSILVWTGTYGDGTWAGDHVDLDFADCGGWTGIVATAGENGQADLIGTSWTEAGQVNCLVPQPIYCFQQS